MIRVHLGRKRALDLDPNPFSISKAMLGDIGSLFNAFTFSNFANEPYERNEHLAFVEDGDSYVLSVPIPGAKRDKIKVMLSHGKRVTIIYNDDANIFINSVQASSALPQDADHESLSVSYVDGVVRVTCKRSSESARLSRCIDIT